MSSVALKSLPTISVYYARQTGAGFGYAMLILTQNLIFVSLESTSFDFFYFIIFSYFCLVTILLFVLFYHRKYWHNKSYDAKYFLYNMNYIDTKRI
ncbi:hypothetical protein FPD38_00030 [Campylobacter volucris]|uniref:Uncharacterized protein n=1 Tax=Campylobacter volucris TaxID=1031542 RepID=A0A5C7E578_9BACT|nr:hypothetical protein [Campylobacter volucris]TXE90063.1 hypothetical protein FPD38_00030 [Campylobacter volucris]